MNIQSEIEFFSDLGLVDKARFVARLIFEIAEEAKVGAGDGQDAVRLRFANEMNRYWARMRRAPRTTSSFACCSGHAPTRTRSASCRTPIAAS
jgi:hypothetical protein